MGKVYLDPSGFAGTLDDISDGSTYKKMSATEQTKLSGIEDNASADQTGAEIRDAILALADAERKIIVSNPTSGQKATFRIAEHNDGTIEFDNSDTPES